MNKTIKIFTIIIIVLVFSYLTIACKSAIQPEEGEQAVDKESEEKEPQLQSDNKGNKIVGEIFDTVPRQEGHIMIGNVGDFEFDAGKIKTVRDDIFKTGTITAIDAIMILGDEAKLRYGLNWYESIGTAGLVKDYFVESINDDISIGRCGFVYEEGSYSFGGFTGNHIHIPLDIRLINSPEYLEYFWICI